MSAKYAQQSMILTYQIFCILKYWSLQGTHDTLLPSMSKHLEKFTILTDQIIHTLKKNFCMKNTVVMWCLFIELIVNFFCKNNTGKIYITQGKHREFHFG